MRTAMKIFGLALVTAAVLAGCGKKDDPVAQAAKKDAAAGVAGAGHRRDQGHRRGRLHLRPADGDELRGDVRVRRRQELRPVQGAVQHDQQRGACLHLQGHGDRHAEQRHAVLDALAGPARRADRDLACRRWRRSATTRCSSSTATPSTTATSAAAPRAASRRLPGRRPRLEGRDAGGHQEGVPVDDAVRAGDLPHAALRRRATCPT